MAGRPAGKGCSRKRGDGRPACPAEVGSDGSDTPPDDLCLVFGKLHLIAPPVPADRRICHYWVDRAVVRDSLYDRVALERVVGRYGIAVGAFGQGFASVPITSPSAVTMSALPSALTR